MRLSPGAIRILAAFAIAAFSLLFCVFCFFVFLVGGDATPTILLEALAIIYLLFWLLFIGTALAVVCQLIGLRTPRFIARKRLFDFQIEKGITLLLAGTSYIYMMLGFAFSYLVISHFDSQAFNLGRLDTISSIYFSVTTIATIGYGDIYPISTFARLLVIFQIAIGLAYPIFFFSIIAGFIKEKS